MMTSRKRNRGEWHGGLIKLIAFAVFIMVFFGGLDRCAREAPRVAGELAAQAASGVGRAVGSGASQIGVQLTAPIGRAWDQFKRKLARIWDNIKGLWENTDDADKLRLACKAVPVDDVDKLCEFFAGPVATATDMQRERIACLWQGAHDSQGIPGVATELQIQGTCAAFRNDRNGLETCLQQQVDPGTASRCLATSPGQFWRSRGVVRPLACPDNVPGTSCAAEQPKPTYKADAKYDKCLYDVAVANIGSVRAGDCAKFNNPPDPEGWEICMATAIEHDLKNGTQVVADCAAKKFSWWHPSTWF